MAVRDATNKLKRLSHRANHTLLHRRLKWIWTLAIPLSLWWRESVIWLVFMSHYTIITGHWSSEEASPEED